MNGLAQTLRRLDALEERMGVADHDVIEIVIVGVDGNGTETSWTTLKIEIPKGKGKQ
jgi:hypothetical protein